MQLDYKGNKAFRLLSVYERLNRGEAVAKEALSREFGISLKTVQRDIDELRAYLAENHYNEREAEIVYVKADNSYQMVRSEREWLNNREVMALCKIILESRAFNKDELSTLIDKLLLQASPADRKAAEDIIRGEYYSYVPPLHGQYLLDLIWQLSGYIRSRSVISFTYRRQDGKSSEKTVKPVSVMFSEYYFYLIAYGFETDKDHPIVFRIDRISDIRATGERFSVPYRDKFDDGEFRRRIQFMYMGELRTVRFEYSGVLEAILDRIPTARVIDEKNGVYTLTCETYGDGIYMWLGSQGDKAKIL